MPANVELYGGLRTGMTKAEANSVLAETERFLTSSCQMTIKKVFEKDRLVSVHLRNKWTLEKSDCYEPIFSSLVEKYGEPQSREVTPAVGSIIPEGTAETWIVDDRVITLSRRGDGTPKKAIGLEYTAKVTMPKPERIPGL